MSITGTNGIGGYYSGRELMTAINGPSNDHPRRQIGDDEEYIPLHVRLQAQAMARVSLPDPLRERTSSKPD